ncbi:hypothetical protein [Candidatus Nitrosacidococcus sp. I8]|uniref:hypothetical protein n=1 Tax=Candidatus Nitrosacidococcus sp. I8 TaxID=2942908 RepID=UPI002227BC7D|nr:hypothetical protein [Candidatus Nitrosacidococcus sp. I8]CAH9018517.1 hypothetical protein NURINAE_00970 [Candidatus Nitrosacidococcus sp. I8]
MKKKCGSQTKVDQLIADSRATLGAAANYRENEIIDRAVKTMIDMAVVIHTLYEISRKI